MRITIILLGWTWDFESGPASSTDWDMGVLTELADG